MPVKGKSAVAFQLVFQFEKRLKFPPHFYYDCSQTEQDGGEYEFQGVIYRTQQIC